MEVYELANIKSAKKRILVNRKKALRNKMLKSGVKTSIKKVDAAIAAGDKEAAAVALKAATSTIDKVTEFIRNKRIAGEPVCYGCSHYLGMEYEREVRDWYFLCTAGLYTASIMVNGDITACLDIERRPEFIQGHILKDNFKDVWENKFQIFRRDLSQDCEKCRNCSEQKFCHGDAYHTWDFDNNCPQVCFKDILF